MKVSQTVSISHDLQGSFRETISAPRTLGENFQGGQRRRTDALFFVISLSVPSEPRTLQTSTRLLIGERTRSFLHHFCVRFAQSFLFRKQIVQLVRTATTNQHLRLHRQVQVKLI